MVNDSDSFLFEHIHLETFLWCSHFGVSFSLVSSNILRFSPYMGNPILWSIMCSLKVSHYSTLSGNYRLCENCSNSGFFWFAISRIISPYLVGIQENTNREKLQIWTFLHSKIAAYGLAKGIYRLLQAYPGIQSTDKLVVIAVFKFFTGRIIYEITNSRISFLYKTLFENLRLYFWDLKVKQKHIRNHSQFSVFG